MYQNIVQSSIYLNIYTENKNGGWKKYSLSNEIFIDIYATCDKLI